MFTAETYPVCYHITPINFHYIWLLNIFLYNVPRVNSNFQVFCSEKITISLALTVSPYLSFQQHAIFKSSHSYLIFIGTFIIQAIILLVGRYTNTLHCRMPGLGSFSTSGFLWFFLIFNGIHFTWEENIWVKPFESPFLSNL